MTNATTSQRRTADGYVSLVESRPESPSYNTFAKKPSRTWKSYVWDTWELPPEERRLLFKVDLFILTFASIGYFLKNIDQTNVNNAFLSGMDEDLGMHGNQLVTSMCRFEPSSLAARAAAHSEVRYFYLDRGLCDRPDPLESTAHAGFPQMGDSVARGGMGYRDDLYVCG